MTNSDPQAEDPGEPPIRWKPDELRFFGITLFCIAFGLGWLLPERLLFLISFPLAFVGVVLNIWAHKLKQIERDANASKFQSKQVSPDKNESTSPEFSLFLRPFSITGRLKRLKRVGAAADFENTLARAFDDFFPVVALVCTENSVRMIT